MTHNWYYDITPDLRHAGDDDGSTIVWLCDECARPLEQAGEIQFASTDQIADVPCWECDKPVPGTYPC